MAAEEREMSSGRTMIAGFQLLEASLQHLHKQRIIRAAQRLVLRRLHARLQQGMLTHSTLVRCLQSPRPTEQPEHADVMIAGA